MSDFFPLNQSVAQTRWLTEEVFKLIELVQRDEAIYNPRHKYYFCRPYVENFWREVDQKLDKNPGASLAKWTNLRISFRREFTNYLEEQVPPCWSYFDRMFFLHPYLRKKQQQPLRPGEPNLQETLAQISELSNRLEHRVAKETIKSASSTDSLHQTTKDSLQETNTTDAQQALEGPNISDHYFDYYDEPNNSELDDIIDDEQNVEVTARYPHVILETATANNKIKSECEDESQEDYERFVDSRFEDDHNIDQVGETSTRNAIVTSSSTRLGKRNQQQLRLEHLKNLQTRSYHEDLRAKRSRSPERSIGNTQAITLSIPVPNSSQRLSGITSTSAHSTTNVSFVRPTFASGTSNINIGSETTNTTTATASNQTAQHQTRQNLFHAHHNLRVDSFGSTNLTSAPSNNNSSNNPGGNIANNSQSTRQLISPTLASTAPTPHLELCDCKTDPDAMFLMSLLPDIQKLNGRDRGKIKIAFQNILQDYLYPD